jgi:hydrogenase maturation protease
LKPSNTKTLVLGIGNTLLRDEGVGVCLVRRMQAESGEHSGVRYLDGGTLSFSLAEEVASHDRLIVLDAADSGSPPGTVRCHEGDDMDRFLARGGRSVHEVGLRDLLDMARLTDGFPSFRALVSVQPLLIDWGEELSEPVEKALPEAARRVRNLIATWNRELPRRFPGR